MTITKKAHRTILLHVFLQDRESVLSSISLFEKHHRLTYVYTDTYTNMFKRSKNEGISNEKDEDVFFFLDVTQNNSYLEIDNVERKIILHINECEVGRFVTNMKRLFTFRDYDLSEQNDIKINNGRNYGAILKINIVNKSFILFGCGKFTREGIDNGLLKSEIERAKERLLGDDEQ